MKTYMIYGRWIIKLGISGIISIVILSAVAFMYNYTGVHTRSVSCATDYVYSPGAYLSTMAEGMAWLHMDQNGYNNAYVSNEAEIDILLMGSSHMEAVNIGSKDNAGYILNERLPNYYVYNIGISGHDFYRCAKNLQAALSEYKPTSWVVIETSEVHLELDKMISVLDGNFENIPIYDEGLLYYLQKYIPGIKLIYKQISNWVNVSEKQTSTSLKTVPGMDEKYKETLNHYLRKMKDSILESQRLLIVYQPTTQIDKNGQYVSTVNDYYSAVFKEACINQNIDFLDLSNDYESLYYESHVLAHGFINSAVGEGHMNKAGHRVFAEAVAEYIKSCNVHEHNLQEH